MNNHAWLLLGLFMTALLLLVDRWESISPG
jgi:hypothetical protein